MEREGERASIEVCDRVGNALQADSTTVSWSPVADAFVYYVHRGDVSGLIDTIPGRGFHYLVSYLSVSGETGLGERSDGVTRTVQAACP